MLKNVNKTLVERVPADSACASAGRDERASAKSRALDRTGSANGVLAIWVRSQVARRRHKAGEVTKSAMTAWTTDIRTSLASFYSLPSTWTASEGNAARSTRSARRRALLITAIWLITIDSEDACTGTLDDAIGVDPPYPTATKWASTSPTFMLRPPGIQPSMRREAYKLNGTSTALPHRPDSSPSPTIPVSSSILQRLNIMKVIHCVPSWKSGRRQSPSKTEKASGPYQSATAYL